jgi:glycosyltransferase involved in cell wall biosynthesis
MRDEVADVSVVIPTTGRASVVAAVESSLAQSLLPHEVIVVAARPLSHDLLSHLTTYHRVRVVDPGAPLTGGAARNAGFGHAQASWVALLDDDDLWVPSKLEVQLAGRDPMERALLACAVRPTTRDAVWPSSPPSEFADLSEFFFVRRGVSQGGYLQTSGLVCPTWLARECPFDESLPILQDIDWVLRLVKEHDATLSFDPHPLVVYETGNASVSSRPRVDACRQWVEEHQHLLTSRARASFLLTVVAERSSRNFDMKSFVWAWREAIRTRASRPRDHALAIMFLVYRPSIRRIRDRLSGRAAKLSGTVR